MAEEVQFNPFEAAIHGDPYPTYRRMLAEDPIHFNELLGVWFLSRHADCAHVLRDQRSFSNARERSDRRFRPPATSRPVYRSILGLDPPEHTRLRNLVSRAFTPRVVENLRPRIRAIVGDLLDAAAGKGGMELVSDLAYPLPVTVIAELLGVPVEDHDRFERWSAVLAAGLDPIFTEEQLDRVLDARDALFDYLRGIADRRRQEPRDDLISGLLAVAELSEIEMLTMCNLLLVAGHETTVNLIGSGVLALLQHPEQLQRLRREPDLAEAAIEELLRFTSPVQLDGRVAAADVDLDGHHVRQGQAVISVVGAANRDPAVFEEPDQLDLGRQPNPHLGFGRGIHFCLGAPLARLEAQVAIPMLFERFPRLRLAGEPELRPTIVLRGLQRLPVAV